jgi:hypothetical protein
MRCDSLHCLECLLIRCNSVIGFCLARVGSLANLMASASAHTLSSFILLVARCKLFQVWGVGANRNSSPLVAHSSPDNERTGGYSETLPQERFHHMPTCLTRCKPTMRILSPCTSACQNGLHYTSNRDERIHILPDSSQRRRVSHFEAPARKSR